MTLSRRGFVAGLLAAPAIIRSPGLLMPLSPNWEWDFSGLRTAYDLPVDGIYLRMDVRSRKTGLQFCTDIRIAETRDRSEIAVPGILAVENVGWHGFQGPLTPYLADKKAMMKALLRQRIATIPV